MAENVLPVIAGMLVLGIGAQLLANRFKVPSVLFLIVIGLIIGPEVLGIVTLETFGAGLTTVVGLSVAIIVFDGAFDLPGRSRGRHWPSDTSSASTGRWRCSWERCSSPPARR